MHSDSAIFLGINGYVIALDRATGQELWRTELGSYSVNVVVDRELVVATNQGEIFALDAKSGKLIWRNKLSGLGRNFVSIATCSGSSITQDAAATNNEVANNSALMGGLTGS